MTGCVSKSVEAEEGQQSSSARLSGEHAWSLACVLCYSTGMGKPGPVQLLRESGCCSTWHKKGGWKTFIFWGRPWTNAVALQGQLNMPKYCAAFFPRAAVLCCLGSQPIWYEKGKTVFQLCSVKGADLVLWRFAGQIGNRKLGYMQVSWNSLKLGIWRRIILFIGGNEKYCLAITV